MTYDGLVDISIGKNRMDKKWQNKELLWSALVEKLKTTYRTHETYKEYIASKKPRQDSIKDIGGFVGGHIIGGRRKNGAISSRTIITLDIDFADNDFWNDWQMIFNNAACLYSTHKHGPNQSRYRLLMPLDRPVTAEEYEAIARKIASWVDIELFDPTTFQPTRLMYWPSTSSDGEYVFEQIDGPWIKADEVLAGYTNWQDTTEWPYHAAIDEDVRTGIKEAGDPLLKPGLIGALCRTYTIQEVIAKYLEGVYEESGVDDRYSYALGSTANGLVIYEDKFAYSHHATDPCGGKLCNAWDLVRIHKFGLMDDRTKEGVKPQDLPSFKAMADLVMEDGAVKRTLGEERVAGAKEAFSEEAGIPGFESGDPDAWMEAMELDRSGNCVSTIDNIVLVLENDPALKGAFAYNAFTNREVMLRVLPWQRSDDMRRHLIDADDSSLRHYMERVYKITGLQKIHDGLAVVLRRHTFHPVREYLEGLEWDGVKRLDTLFVDWLGAEDSDYMQAITRKTLIAAVKRIFEPGCKFDNLPVFAGEEGTGKSTLIDKLGGIWYSDSFMGVQGVLAMEQLQGVWIMEIAELNGFKKAEEEAIKHFISKRSDEFRVAYGRRKDTFPRQGIFIGSTNMRDFLKSYNGNRRFWPVVTDMKKARYNIFKEFSQEIINQVWAEAYLGWLGGEEVYLSKVMEAAAKEVQSEHMEEDIRTGMVQHYLDTLVPADWKEKSIYERRAWLQAEKDDMTETGTMIRKQVSVAEIHCECFNLSLKDITPWTGREYNNIMSRVKGWAKTGKMVTQNLYGRQRIFEKVLD